MNDSGVYKITNVLNGKVYIGSSVNLEKRLNHHKGCLKNNKHKNAHLQRAYNKDGEASFIYEVIEYCDSEFNFEREQYWMDLTKCTNRKFGYNINPFATGILDACQEIRDKRSIAMKKHWQREEFRRALCGRDPWNKGKKLSDEHVAKLKSAVRVFSEEGQAKRKIQYDTKRANLNSIEVFDLFGNYIATFESAIELERLSEISEVVKIPKEAEFKKPFKGKPIHYLSAFHVNRCCKGMILSYKGLVFKYKEKNGRSIE